MNVRHDDDGLSQLEDDPDFETDLSQAIVRAFRKVMRLVRDVVHEGELYSFKSLHFEKLKGKRKHQQSLRLNDQWRLIVEIEESKEGNVLVVKGIEDYH